MSADLQIQGAMAMANAQAVQAPHPTGDAVAAKKVAGQFEGVLVSQFLNEMFAGIKTDGPFGGGQGEEMFRSLMIDEYGKQIAAQGGFGLSASVTKELLKRQETVQ
jgi:Rod binding domain-containing protein